MKERGYIEHIQDVLISVHENLRELNERTNFAHPAFAASNIATQAPGGQAFPPFDLSNPSDLSNLSNPG